MGKGPIIGLCAVLLVACIIAVAVSIEKGNSLSPLSTSNKAVISICEHTLHKDACIKSLADQEETNPKELVKAEFKAAIENIREAIKNSEPIKEVQKDASTKKAVEDCNEFLETSIENLQRSLNKFGKLDTGKIDKFRLDMETWLSAALIWQETCLDQFDNTTRDAGEMMKKNLNVSSELSSNVLAFVTHISKVLGDVKIPDMKNRRLLEAARVDEEPLWMDASRWRLLQANPKPDAVVALDGSGNFKSINEAIKTVPKNNNRAFVILVKPGVYKEYVDIPKGINGVVLVGSGIANTKITGSKSNAKGVKTFASATVAVNGNYFTAKDITIENTAGPQEGQAVALRISGDFAVIFNCQIDGYQDTLYVHANRQFFRDCTISGTVDFIFGDARVVLQNCRIVARKPKPGQANMMTAQGRKDPNENGAIILQNCYLTGEPALVAANPPSKTYLGRPWKAYSRTIIMQSFIDGVIAPEGWSPWTGNMYLDTLYYAEFGNRGPGSNTAQRVNWKGIKKISAQEAQSYTPGTFIEADPWVKITGFPYEPGMMKV